MPNIFCSRFNQIHLINLIRCYDNEGIIHWLSPLSPIVFVQRVFNDPNLHGILYNPNEEPGFHFPENQVNREHVWNILNDNNDISNLAKVLIVLAWGGMRIPNARQALQSYHGYWGAIIDDMLNNQIDDMEAYRQFYVLTTEGNLRGMGPAFFTKLIFFLGQKPNSPDKGYIMDQWTARSMNMLKCPDYIKFGKYVGKRNDETIYRKFCEDLEVLTKCMGMQNPEETEQLLFSGRRRCWRKYVKIHG